MSKILQFEDVTLRYGTVAAISGLTFDIQESGYVCLAGHNGSGKSSCLKAALGLLRPSRGSIKLLLPHGLVGYVPQMPDIPANFPATVEEVVLMGRQRGLFYSAQDKKAAAGAMDALEISSLAKKRRIGELSGGQTKRVLLARAICREPRFLVMDEPCAGLDVDVTDTLYGLLTCLNKKGSAILMATHDVERVTGIATSVINLGRQNNPCDHAHYENIRQEGDAV